MTKKKIILISSIVCIVSAVMLLVSLFLPYASLKKDYADDILSEPAYEVYSGKYKVTSHDLVKVSLFKFTRVYSTYGKEIFRDPINSVFYVVLFSLFSLFGLLILLFAALRKPAPIIVFDCLLFIVFLINNKDYSMRGVVPGNRYDFGVAHTLYFVFLAIIFVSAVTMLVMKMMIKRENKIQLKNN